MPEPVRRVCTGCGATVKIPAAAAARALKCPRCGGALPAGELGVPVVVAPAVVAPADPFADLAADPFEIPAATPRPVPPRGRGGLLVWVTLALVTAAGVAGGALYGPALLNGRPAPAEVAKPVQPAEQPPATPSAFAGAAAPFPRRLLVVSVTKYLYLNPLTGGNSLNPDLVTVAARRLAYQWRVPTTPDNNQLFVVSDAGPRSTPALKSAVVAAVAGFARTARPQDRAAIYYGGHAAMVKGVAHLVPTDGDPSDPKSLYPLAEFFAAVAASPAQEKFVAFDVCRVDESGNRQRPGSEVLSAELEKALLTPPPGVRVALTAKAGQNALEFRAPPSSAMPEVGGSLFLSAITHLAEQGKVSPALDPAPADPLPVDAWVAAITKRMTAVAAEAGLAPPALQVAGQSIGAVAPDPAAGPAARFESPPPPVGLPVAEVAKLSGRVGELPPYRGKPGPDDSVDDLVPYDAALLGDYRPDGPADTQVLASPDAYPVRAAAISMLAVIKKEWRSAGTDVESGLRTELRGATNEALKKEILAEQEVPARIEDELDTVLLKAQKVADKLPGEKSKYWRATYHYALAQTKARLAFMQEYNKSLGLIRTDSIPPVDAKKGEAGLVLVSSEKMASPREVKELADSAAEDFAKVAADYPGTPWAVLARRHQVMALGLVWKPSVVGKAVKLE